MWDPLVSQVVEDTFDVVMIKPDWCFLNVRQPHVKSWDSSRQSDAFFSVNFEIPHAKVTLCYPQVHKIARYT